MSNTDEIKRLFQAYVDIVQERLHESFPIQDSAKLLVRDVSFHHLREVVESLERSGQYSKLSLSYMEYCGSAVRVTDSENETLRKVLPVMGNLPAFFRRSRFYLDALKGATLESGIYLQRLLKSRREVKVTRLWLFDGVEFTQDIVDLGSFKFRRYQPQELEALVGNDVNRVFYPDSVIDASTLSSYWFLVEEEVFFREGVVDAYLLQTERTGVADTSIFYRGSDQPLEIGFPPRPIQLMSLAIWSESPEPEFFKPFPFEMQVDDDLFESPSPLINKVSPPDMYPARRVSEEHLNSLRQQIGFAERVFSQIEMKKHGWHFLELALGFLGKAFVTENPLEQLVWYIVVIESLFGEKSGGGGVTDLLATRLGKALGGTKRKRKEYKERFKELYAFRCALVHGNSSSVKATMEHLAEAREFARLSVILFLRHVESTFQRLKHQGFAADKFPRREDFLRALGLDEDAKDRLKSIPSFHGALPTKTDD